MIGAIIGDIAGSIYEFHNHKSKVWMFIALTGAYVVISFALYVKMAGKRAFAKGGYFYMEDSKNN